MPSIAPIIHLPLTTPDIAASKARYGVEFVVPTIAQLTHFEQLCSTLIGQQQRILNEHGEEYLPTKPAVVYDPSAFLRQPLTPQQVMAINERETPQVAAYCVALHGQLAKVPIKESGERFQHLPTMFSAAGVAATFSDIPFPAICGPWANKPQEFWARESFAQRLVIMGQLLNAVGVQLHFIEAFRPLGVQEAMFRRRVRRTRNEHPRWRESQVIAESKSKTAYTPRLASHKGGAAMDILLQDMRTGQLLDFGHQYPDGGVLVFPRSPYVTATQWSNRQLLQVSAGLSGLTLYVGEDWHVSFGDNLASLDERGKVRKDYIAQYGPVKDFDRTTGEVRAIYTADELDQMLAY